MKIRTAIAAFTLGTVILGGCGQPPDTDVKAAPTSATDTTAAPPSFSSPATTATTMTDEEFRRLNRLTDTTELQAAAPTLSLTCPESHTSTAGPVRFSFGSQFEWFVGPPLLRVDYGDGKSFSTDSAEEAQANGFWHDYSTPGTYTVNASLTDGQNRTVNTNCSFRWALAAAPAPTSPPALPSPGGSYGGSPGSTAKVGGCYYEGTALWGAVKVVDFGADITVKVVDFGADLRVKKVDFGATSCGLWKFVDYGADFTVKFVDYGADISVKFVDFGAGQ